MMSKTQYKQMVLLTWRSALRDRGLLTPECRTTPTTPLSIRFEVKVEDGSTTTVFAAADDTPESYRVMFGFAEKFAKMLGSKALVESVIETRMLLNYASM